MTLRPGDLAGDFLVLEHLGSGGMGDVYKTEHTRRGCTIRISRPCTARGGIAIPWRSSWSTSTANR
jgi:hypothetical protein